MKVEYMRIADNWTEYKVLDVSDGEKLENWAGYTLIRPDPQVIWSSDKQLRGWRKPDAHYLRSAKGGGEWQFFSLPETWELHYTLGLEPVPGSVNNTAGRLKSNINTTGGINSNSNIKFATVNKDSESVEHGSCIEGSCKCDITFHLKPFAFKHTGVFPEQAANWDLSYRLIRERIAAQPDRTVRVLNLFAYTGGATLAAAAAGAFVTHVDASKGMVSWAKENAASSGLQDAHIRWLVDDCRKFVERELRRGNSYDAIIMDPPSYGRGPKGEIWKIEESIYPFVQLCAGLLSDNPLFFLINSYTTGLQAGVLTAMLKLAVASRFGGHCDADELGLNIEGSDLVLPAGASGIWTA